MAGVIEAMLSPRVLAQLHVLPTSARAFGVLATGADRRIGVGGAMKDMDRTVAHLLVIDEGGIAEWIERQIGGKRVMCYPMLRWKRMRLGYRLT